MRSLYVFRTAEFRSRVMACWVAKWPRCSFQSRLTHSHTRNTCGVIDAHNCIISTSLHYRQIVNTSKGFSFLKTQLKNSPSVCCRAFSDLLFRLQVSHFLSLALHRAFILKILPVGCVSCSCLFAVPRDIQALKWKANLLSPWQLLHPAQCLPATS